MRIDLSSLVGERVLAGAAPGARTLPLLIEQMAKDDEDIVFVDFQNVDVATGSFLRESILALKDYLRRNENRRAFVLANINAVVEEELQAVLLMARDAVVSCTLNSAGHVQRAKIVGTLDPKQRLALREVIVAGEIDAPTLSQKYRKTENVGTTAWNNRLAFLADKGIIREVRTGRTKMYRPVLKELLDGP